MSEQNEIKKELLGKWLKAKAKEEKANDERIEIERQIEEIYANSLPIEGSTTIKEDDFKINFNKGFTYALDTDEYIKLIPEIPEQFRPHKIKMELDKTGWKYLVDNKEREGISDIYRLVSQCVTIKPRKTGIKVEKI